MSGPAWLVITKLGIASALAATSELEALDQQLQAVHVAPGADLSSSPEDLLVAVQALQVMEATVGRLPEDQRDAGLLRLAEGYRILAGDLLAIPCPAQLDPVQCALFRGLLAEKAQPLATKAATGMVHLESSTALGRSDRRRRAALAAELGQLNQALEAATGAMPSAQAPPPRPEPGNPQQPAVGWNPPSGRAGEDARFAVIRGIAGLLRESGEPVATADPAHPPGEDQLYVVELMGRQDGLAEVRLGGAVDWEKHCVPHQTLARWVAIRAWIPEEALLPVVAEDLVVEHTDGTGLRLLPGAPVLDGQAWLDGQLISLPEGAHTTGDYGADETRLQRVYGADRIPWATTGSMGGEPFALRQAAYDYNDMLTISSATPRGDASLITLTARCGELRFLAPAPEPSAQLGGVLGLLGGAAGDAVRVTLRPGTPVYWVDGQAAGQVVEEHSMLASELYGTSMRCLEAKVGSAEARHVPLCFDPADLGEP